MERTTVWLGNEDREAIAEIRRRFGLAHDADAMRLAFRLAAEAHLNVELLPPEVVRKGGVNDA